METGVKLIKCKCLALYCASLHLARQWGKNECVDPEVTIPSPLKLEPIREYIGAG